MNLSLKKLSWSIFSDKSCCCSSTTTCSTLVVWATWKLVAAVLIALISVFVFVRVRVTLVQLTFLAKLSPGNCTLSASQSPFLCFTSFINAFVRQELHARAQSLLSFAAIVECSDELPEALEYHIKMPLLARLLLLRLFSSLLVSCHVLV